MLHNWVIKGSPSVVVYIMTGYITLGILSSILSFLNKSISKQRTNSYRINQLNLMPPNRLDGSFGLASDWPTLIKL